MKTDNELYQELKNKSTAMRILLEEFDKYQISHDWHYVDDSSDVYEAIESAMNRYVKEILK